MTGRRGTLASTQAQVLLLAGAVVTLLLAVAPRYGWHRDELYFLACGRRLAWGYVDQPPFTPAVARLSSELFGGSLLALRLFPAVAVASVVVLTASTARRLGGGRTAQLVAGLAAALCPLFLGAGHLLSTATFDLAAWTVITWLVVCLLVEGRERLWLAVGVAAGVGFLNKHTVAFLVAALLVGLVAGGGARHLRSRWLWAGAGLGALVALPNVIWHAQHGWPVFEMLGSLQRESGNEDALLFAPSQLAVTAGASVVWVPGLVWLLRAPEARRARPLGLAYLALLAVFVVTSAKPYYLAGVYPVLLAAGGVAWERRGRFAPAVVMAGVNVLALPLALPILPARAAADLPIEDLEVEFGAQLGWELLVEHVAQEWSALPPAERERAVILAGNYGEAAAVDRFGPARGLPPAYSGHNSYWLWGPPPAARGAAILVGVDPSRLGGAFGACALRWTFHSPHGVASEEEGATMVVCRDQRVDWDDLWPSLKSYSA